MDFCWQDGRQSQKLRGSHPFHDKRGISLVPRFLLIPAHRLTLSAQVETARFQHMIMAMDNACILRDDRDPEIGSYCKKGRSTS
jgi:hypothetical protein